MEEMNKKILKLAFVLAWAFAIPAFVFSVNSLWQHSAHAASTTPATLSPADLLLQQQQQAEADKKAKEAKALKDKLDQALKQQAALEQNLGQIQQNVAVKQNVITSTKAVISDTAETIARKQAEMQAASDRLDLQQQLLKNILQQLYVAQTEPAVGIVLAGTEFSQVFGNVDNLETLEDKLISVSNDIADSKNQVASEADQLAVLQQSKEQVLGATVAQQQNLLADQADTQQSIDDKAATIAKLQQQLTELQGGLNQMTGGSYSIDDIWSAVKKASSNTGVPKGFLMGILGTETHFGSNIGTGTYKTDMSPDQRPTFESLCKSLGLNPSKMPVSRRICYNTKAKDGCGGWGGAMGAEQFIPSTWMGYTSRVSSITGNSPASPWNLDDGITAMAIKLKQTPGVTSGSTSALKSATCSYLGTCSASYMSSVMYWVNNYQDVLN